MNFLCFFYFGKVLVANGANVRAVQDETEEAWENYAEGYSMLALAAGEGHARIVGVSCWL